MNTFDTLLRGLAHPGVAWEIAILAACLLTALAVSWGAGRGKGDQSVWFGRGVVDGLLFPLLALVLTYGAMLLLAPSQPVALLRIAVPVLVSLAGIRFLARVLTVVFPASGMARLAERLFSWLAWLGAVLWIVGLLPAVTQEMDAIRFTFSKSRVSLLDLAGGVLSAGAVMVVVLWVSAVLERRVLQQAVSDLSLRKVAANTVRATLLLVGLLLALSTVGVDLTALSVLGGALGVGLGFGLQKLAANYVSGFVILFERSLRIGDIVRVDNFEGEVMDIKTRYTLIRAPNGRESIVPNEKLITERIENLSLADPRVLLTSEVTVGNDSDVDIVQKVLVDAALAVPRVLRDPAPAARLVRLGPDGLEFSLLYWIEDPVNGQLNVRSDTNLQVLRGLRAAGIDSPIPQRVVQMRPAAPG
jgi:small-conductance mechanosensitive channel